MLPRKAKNAPSLPKWLSKCRLRPLPGHRAHLAQLGPLSSLLERRVDEHFLGHPACQAIWGHFPYWSDAWEGLGLASPVTTFPHIRTWPSPTKHTRPTQKTHINPLPQRKRITFHQDPQSLRWEFRIQNPSWCKEGWMPALLRGWVLKRSEGTGPKQDR